MFISGGERVIDTADLVAQLLVRRGHRPTDEAGQCAHLGIVPPLDPSWWMNHFLRLPESPLDGTIVWTASRLVYDGLELAALLTGEPPGGAHTIREHVEDPFYRRAVMQSPILLDGPLADVVVQFTDAVLPPDPFDDRAAVIEAGAIMFAMGLLLHHHIHGVVHPAYADLLPAAVVPIDAGPPAASWWRAEGAQPFLDQILAAPDDDGPRLVFADWLMERDDPFGELISAQCQAEAARGKRRVELTDRADALLARYGRDWGAEILRGRLGMPRLGPTSNYGRPYVRGFLHGVEGDINPVLDQYEALLRYPLRTAELTNITPAIGLWLANLPAHPTIDRWDLKNYRVGISPEILESPFFDRVESLDFGSNRLLGPGIAYFDGLRTRRLRRLSLDSCDLEPHHVSRLSFAPCMQTVEHLRLHRNRRLDDTILEPLARLPRLRSLDLDGTHVSALGAARYPAIRIRANPPAR